MSHSGPLPPCGTQQAYQRHIKKGEKPCDPCRLAHNEYLKDYRNNKQPAESKEHKRLLMQARSKALTHLSREYPDHFADILNTYLKEVGLPPRK